MCSKGSCLKHSPRRASDPHRSAPKSSTMSLNVCIGNRHRWFKTWLPEPRPLQSTTDCLACCDRHKRRSNTHINGTFTRRSKTRDSSLTGELGISGSALRNFKSTSFSDTSVANLSPRTILTEKCADFAKTTGPSIARTIHGRSIATKHEKNTEGKNARNGPLHTRRTHNSTKA